MRVSTYAALTVLSVGMRAGFAADATTPIDYRDRNEAFVPADNGANKKQKPITNSGLQDKRFEKPVVEKKSSPLGDRQVPIDLKETRAKNVREKESHRPERIEHVTSDFDHRQSAISTTGDATKPPMVAKYQDSLAAASTTNMARYPAMDKATSAKINRFVFRKNPTDAAGSVNGSPVTPAAGGSVLQR